MKGGEKRNCVSEKDAEAYMFLKSICKLEYEDTVYRRPLTSMTLISHPLDVQVL